MSEETRMAVIHDGLDNLGRASALLAALGPTETMAQLGVSVGDAAIRASIGMELGIPPMQAIMGLRVVKAALIMPAAMMARLVMCSPLCEYLRCVESTDTVCTYETQRRGHPAPDRASYTIEMAQRAGLLRPTPRGEPSNWLRHPEAMLEARAKSRLVRRVYPDVVAGAYVEDEAAEIRGEYREQPAQSTGRVYDIRESAPVHVQGLEHQAIDVAVPEPRGPRDWWDGWRTACEAIGLAFADALAITRGAGVDTDGEGAVRASWPDIEAKVRKLSRTQQPSRSRDGKGYELTRGPERWRCNCEAGSFGRPCIHAAAAEVGWWRGLMAPSAWATIAAVCGDRPADDKLDEALALVRSWRDMMAEVGE